jgi:AcrR family transcriptional regulator
MSIEERQREEKEQRRRSIVDAAEAVLGRKSREEMTMSDVADEARLSRSLLYVYFEDMEDIVLAVTLRGLQSLRESFETARHEHETGLMQIRAIGEAYIRFARAEPTYFDLVARFEARTADLNDATDRERQCVAESNRVMTAMTGAIEQGIDDGSIRPGIDPMETAVMLWAYTHGLLQLVANRGDGLEQRYDLAAETLLESGLNFIGVALTGVCQQSAPHLPDEALPPGISPDDV